MTETNANMEPEYMRNEDERSTYGYISSYLLDLMGCVLSTWTWTCAKFLQGFHQDVRQDRRVTTNDMICYILGIHSHNYLAFHRSIPDWYSICPLLMRIHLSLTIRAMCVISTPEVHPLESISFYKELVPRRQHNGYLQFSILYQLANVHPQVICDFHAYECHHTISLDLLNRTVVIHIPLSFHV